MLYKEGLAVFASEAIHFSIDNDAENWHRRLKRLPWGIHMGNPAARSYWTSRFSDIFGTPYDTSDVQSNAVKWEKKDCRLIASMTSFGNRLMNDAPLVIQHILEKQTM